MYLFRAGLQMRNRWLFGICPVSSRLRSGCIHEQAHVGAETHGRSVIGSVCSDELICWALDQSLCAPRRWTSCR